MKTDNHNPAAKLELRRHFLRKYHATGPVSVMDCCQGSGLLWRTLSQEFPCKVWGLDVKPKKGRLKLDSARVLAQPGWTQNVIDIDTYGSPWKHWQAMLPNVTEPVTVFLTIGQLRTGTVGSLGNAVLSAMGLLPLAKLPPAFHVKLRGIVVGYCLAECKLCGLDLVEAVEAVSDGNARYIGVRLSRPV